MNIITKVKGWLKMLFGEKATKEFGVEELTSEQMKNIIAVCEKIYQGHPGWVDPDNHIKTVNFAKSICSEVARLTTLAVGVKVDGGSRAEWLQKQIDDVYFQLRRWAEYGNAYGTVILKPNGEDISMYLPTEFIVTEQRNGEITGCVFVDKATSPTGDEFYTKLEYHRFTGEAYAVSNRCYVGKSEGDMGKTIAIELTPWAGLLPDVEVENITAPLYGVFRTPHANNVDVGSPLSMPVYADAIEELKDLDIAYSRNAKEIQDSKRTVLLDSDRMLPAAGGKVAGKNYKREAQAMGLPDYVKNVYGDGTTTFYQEINPTLNTAERLNGINSLLSQIGYKCGFSNGYFVFNEKSGIQTATGVEAEQQRTVLFVKDCRDKLESCIKALVYALNVYADLYDLAPVGEYEINCNFGDILYNYEEDKAVWKSYVLQKWVPVWVYLVKFENMTEEEAKEMVAEAQPKETLFGEDE